MRNEGISLYGEDALQNLFNMVKAQHPNDYLGTWEAPGEEEGGGKELILPGGIKLSQSNGEAYQALDA